MDVFLDHQEVKALRYSAGGALLVGCAALVFAHLSRSDAILLDGLFNLTYFATGLFTLKVTRLLARGDTREFPMGYDYFEPLVNGLKGILILGVTAMAMADAFIAIVSGGRTIDAGMAIGYGVFATLGCGVVALIMRNASKRTGSPLVQADATNWIVNGAISSGVLLTFLCILLIRDTPLAVLLPYIDPALVLLVAAACIMVPIRMGWGALLGLLNRAPEGVTEQVRGAVERAIAGLSVSELFVRVIQPGRYRKVMVHVVLAAEHELESVASLDELRESTFEKLTDQHPQVVLDMLFTVDRKWGAPAAEWPN